MRLRLPSEPAAPFPLLCASPRSAPPEPQPSPLLLFPSLALQHPDFFSMVAGLFLLLF